MSGSVARCVYRCFFALLQRDTRIFHKFGSGVILRASRLGQAPLPPLPPGVAPMPSGAGEAAPMAAALPNESQAAERIARMPALSESVEELLIPGAR